MSETKMNMNTDAVNDCVVIQWELEVVVRLVVDSDMTQNEVVAEGTESEVAVAGWCGSEIIMLPGRLWQWSWSLVGLRFAWWNGETSDRWWLELTSGHWRFMAYAERIFAFKSHVLFTRTGIPSLGVFGGSLSGTSRSQLSSSPLAGLLHLAFRLPVAFYLHIAFPLTNNVNLEAVIIPV